MTELYDYPVCIFAHQLCCFVCLCVLCCRYGLYSSPFDPVLFDLEVSGSSCKNAFNSSIGVQSDEIDLSDILSGERSALCLSLHHCIDSAICLI